MQRHYGPSQGKVQTIRQCAEKVALRCADNMAMLRQDDMAKAIQRQ